MAVTAREILASINAVRVQVEKFHAAILDELAEIEGVVRSLDGEAPAARQTPIGAPFMPAQLSVPQAYAQRQAAAPKETRRPRTKGKRAHEQRVAAALDVIPTRAAERAVEAAPRAKKRRQSRGPNPDTFRLANEAMRRAAIYPGIRYNELIDEIGMNDSQARDVWNRLTVKGAVRVSLPDPEIKPRYWPKWLPPEEVRVPMKRDRSKG